MARQIAVIDSETDPFKSGRVPKPFIWGFYDGKEYKDFETVQDLIKYIREKNIIVYAHNGGKFDYHFMLNEIGAFKEIMLINNRLARFKIGKCEFRDSLNILPIALDKYKKTEIDYNKFEPGERQKHMTEIKSYLKDDCIFLYEIVSEFVKTYGAKLTLAGAAFDQWKKISNRKIPPTGETMYNKIAPYYCGGRVECFEKGIFKDDINIYDINSAYPYAMTFKHPFGASYDVKKGDLNEEIIDQNFYTITGKSKGGLPFRGADNSLSFPNDNALRQYHATGWEINTALEFDTLKIKEIETVISYYDEIDFTDYVNHFYEMKQKAKKSKPEYIFAKLFLNSLYGKWAANPSKYAEYILMPQCFIDIMTKEIIEKVVLIDNYPESIPEHIKYIYLKEGWKFAGEFGINGLIRRGLDDDDKRFYNVAVAASITGFVRAYLFRAIRNIRNGGGRILYCDTDSISFIGDHDLSIGGNLGQWDYEGTFRQGAIAGKKLYAFIDGPDGEIKTATKGARLTPAEIFKIAKGETVTYKSEAPTFSPFKEPTFLERNIKMT